MESMKGMKEEFAQCLHALVEAEGTPKVHVLDALSPEAWIGLFEHAPMPLRRELHDAAMRRCHQHTAVQEMLAKVSRMY